MTGWSIDLWALIPIVIGLFTIALTVFRIFIIKPLEKLNDKLDKINEAREQCNSEVSDKFSELVDKINDQDRAFIKTLHDIYTHLIKMTK